MHQKLYLYMKTPYLEKQLLIKTARVRPSEKSGQKESMLPLKCLEREGEILQNKINIFHF